MGSLRVTLCTTVLAAAALTPAAYAADMGGVSVIPATPAPGSDVTLRVTGCAQRTAVAASAAFVADARLTVTVTDGDRELVGESRVRSTLTAGTYAVKVTCGDAERTGTLTVRDGDRRRAAVPGAGGQSAASGDGGHSTTSGDDGQSAASGAGAESSGPEVSGPEVSGPEASGPEASGPEDSELQASGPEASGPPSPHASPVAPVQAGGGGAADLVAAEERGAGPGTAQGVTGLVLAGVAAVVVALGGVRRSRGTD
ncbi:hypothetical protein ABZ568_26955 [Streptomyces olindensis]|uniref:Uncharacterized protein n=1 Tax=Streptomyces olindensis TaxID=358823 RepID=A0ABV2Y1Q7_9ACTN